MTAAVDTTAPQQFAAFYRMIWRWHFYAGLFCLPFVIVLSISGAVYLFKPQIDAFFDAPYTHLTLNGPAQSLDDQVAAARKAFPDARLKAVELRADPTDAARVSLIDASGAELRVLVRPDTLEILKSETQKSRLTQFMHDLHGELLIGEPGAIVLELTGAWAIIMVLTGLYLWWPRMGGVAGVLYPRLTGGSRRVLRDLHAVAGFWLSLFALFFLLSALPWTKVWGSAFKELRGVTPQQALKQDWTTGPASAKAKRMADYKEAPPAQSEAVDEHAEHRAHKGGPQAARIEGFERLAEIVRPLHLAEPALLLPPSPQKPFWQARSESQNRPLRVALSYDPASFALVKQEDFSSRALVDKIVGVGVAAHEGQLFGWFNQLLGLLTAIGFLVLCVTSALMWWRRRPSRALGAPPALAAPPRLAPALIATIVVLGALLPTLGASLIVVFFAETAIKRFAPALSLWLGLTPPPRVAALP
jgi:uncharacterized iron-regulated membrane protein